MSGFPRRNDNGGIYLREGTAEDAAAVAQADERKGRRGAVGGNGYGGWPPDQTAYDPLFAVKAVFVSPGRRTATGRASPTGTDVPAAPRLTCSTKPFRRSGLP